MGEEPACSAGEPGDMGLIPALGRSPGVGHTTHSSVLAWRIPWTVGPGGPQCKGRKESDTPTVPEHSRAPQLGNIMYLGLYSKQKKKWGGQRGHSRSNFTTNEK